MNEEVNPAGTRPVGLVGPPSGVMNKEYLYYDILWMGEGYSKLKFRFQISPMGYILPFCQILP